MKRGYQGRDLITAAASSAAVIVPSDSADLPNFSRGIYIGGAGNLTVDMVDQPGVSVQFVAVPAGAVLPIQVRKVYATGTSASALVALY